MKSDSQASLGMIALNDSESYGLPTGGDSKIPGQHIFQVSMYHQIQCLYLIRKVYWGESSGIYNVSAEPPRALVAHTNHCFDYLLQGIKCAGDMTLEWKTDFNGNFVGWDVPHTCKSWVSELFKVSAAIKLIEYYRRLQRVSC